MTSWFAITVFGIVCVGLLVGSVFEDRLIDWEKEKTANFKRWYNRKRQSKYTATYKPWTPIDWR